MNSPRTALRLLAAAFATAALAPAAAIAATETYNTTHFVLSWETDGDDALAPYGDDPPENDPLPDGSAQQASRTP